MHVAGWLSVAVVLGWVGVARTETQPTARFSLSLDPAVGVPLTGPQRDAFGVGGGAFIHGAYGPRGWLDLQLTAGALAFNPTLDGGDPPGVFAFGGGIRLKFPQERDRISPFFDAAPLFVRTGELNRFGFSVASGVLFALDKPRTYWLGFHVRYLQVVQGEEAGFDTTDANLLLFGVSTQFGVARQTAPVRDGVNDAPDRDADGDRVVEPVDTDQDGVLDNADRCPAVAGPTQNDGCPSPDIDKDGFDEVADKCPAVVGLAQFGGCPDHDNDGVPEPPDLCPDKAGSADNDGCPRYKEIVVTSKAIILGQKIFFAHDKATILPTSYALLDDVVQAFSDYPGLKVRIEGHTDAKGRIQHNMKLSQARADAVRTYMLDKGVGPDRIPSATGYGPTQPLDTNKTEAGRERNRRVEFVVEGRGEQTLGP